jgi:cytochrome c
MRRRTIHRHSLAAAAACLCALAWSALAHAQTLQSANMATTLGNPDHGEHLYETRCGGCHAVDTNRVGPLHRGVFGRRAGTAPGYAYSPALQRSGLTWDAATLDRWLSGPTRLVPGTRMGISVPASQDRQDIIAYLASLGRPPSP